MTEHDQQPVRDEAKVSRFIENFAAQLVIAGMPSMPARVFAAILSSDTGELTSAQLGEQLRVSPAGVSGAVRYLSQQHMVTRRREPGSRRERYVVQGTQWFQALTNRDAVLKRWAEAMREGVASLGPETPAGRRMAETQMFFEFLEAELADLMERWDARRRALGFSD
ncbi:GbsR/MarR family transcriptional regulator [Streptomyces uncialis]|uniref:MarR family transcriptional regulator n=1 Tax=Streptomyces uncialis TaxID=1048205 RepID=A0A1Q4VD31_9ACTN|nr:MarR family transcriptional regulator [Streptomyces uncialis]MCX4661189.1 MarR family transcriptional regulator [Streptomyces uncialis]OKH95669.1 MarR family transcriptional regulator [Streptomyces uncialis]WST69114.1 MarR family transcriptional regulator [Streptomyces uncialis]WTE12190.1 MarR family transcriptional regulator [Streptomyces uncialis]